MIIFKIICMVGIIFNLFIAILITKHEVYEKGEDFTLSDLITALLLSLLPFLLVFIIVSTRASDPVILKGKKK